VESSLKTTSISLFAIVYLLSSGIPHFQWIGITLIGWCGMQFAEMLLWLTEPKNGCTFWNMVITMTLIPLILVLQPLGPLWGSTVVFPWNKSSSMRKYFMIMYTVVVLMFILLKHYILSTKYCTTVTKEGHLYWMTEKDGDKKIEKHFNLYYHIWLTLVILPLILFWNISLLFPLLLFILPSIGFLYGFKTDSKGSIWCYYTSYSSIIAIICLFMQQNGIYNFTSPSSFHL
jgi:hypothetical protein